MESKDIRWQQRFQNFERALRSLEEALAIEQPDVVQRAGLIQFFEITFELAWKLLKDYLEAQGFTEVKSPRAVLKQAFEVELIVEGHQWLQGLQDRNLTAHTYNEETAVLVENLVRQTYYPLLSQLYQTFSQLPEQPDDK
jgi:nucleotidyltransferase substrate binding protein (TIGR01987 family)